jgi:ribosomal protein S18 acetylase RimI-like enzyme
MISTVLGKHHHRKNFICGVPELDNYLKQYVNQDSKRNLTVCYVIADQSNNVLGYYTLSSTKVDLSEIPDRLGKSLKYLEIPVIFIGRLALDQAYQGRELGKLLLIDALKRCLEVATIVGVHAVVVDPTNELAKKFHTKLGFTPLVSSKRMFLPLHTIAHLLHNG